ncbi:MAG: hypothetical protein PVI30_05125 [Myxococcales bacterium]|jgi:hypothetical protein
MAQYVLLMKGTAGDPDSWTRYVERLIATGKFRGGSSLGNGASIRKGAEDSPCVVTGHMRFEADSFDEARKLIEGNPVYEAGGEVELLEEVRT